MKTLHNAKLDKKFLLQLKEKYPAIFEVPYYNELSDITKTLPKIYLFPFISTWKCMFKRVRNKFINNHSWWDCTIHIKEKAILKYPFLSLYWYYANLWIWKRFWVRFSSYGEQYRSSSFLPLYNSSWLWYFSLHLACFTTDTYAWKVVRLYEF